MPIQTAGRRSRVNGRVRRNVAVRIAAALLLGPLLVASGCGVADIFSPAFINTLFGGFTPVTPGPGAAFVFVRTVNVTDQNVEFIVTIERDVLVRDPQGIPRQDEQDNFITTPERETVRLSTFPAGQARELGVLFPCGESPVKLVGLGENLLPTDSAVFVGGQGPAGTGGFGVAATRLNPLSLEFGNFNCGDTIIFRAFRSFGTSGGIGLESLLLPGSEQPSQFLGLNTFANYEAFLDSQSREEGP